MDGNLYQVLGLAFGASDLDIKLAFERSKRALQARVREHPDERDLRAAQLQELNSAYVTLTNPARRRAYDESLYARAVNTHGAAGNRSERAFFKQFVAYGGLPLLVIAGLAVVLAFFHETRPAEHPAPVPAAKSLSTENGRGDRPARAGAQRHANRSTTSGASSARDPARARDGNAPVSGAQNLGDDGRSHGQDASAARDVEDDGQAFEAQTGDDDSGMQHAEPLVPEHPPGQLAQPDERTNPAADERVGDGVR
ncbi:MAG: DnaJ domain-containing protein [Gammaproteobacteria bacterium]|nr:DnaJ domain-containing protein [Gammaproteobacteria bacterium]MBI5617236.1 DnaJ domain-containing protein [Gammaproteobacteria bacterium]